METSTNQIELAGNHSDFWNTEPPFGHGAFYMSASEKLVLEMVYKLKMYVIPSVAVVGMVTNIIAVITLNFTTLVRLSGIQYFTGIIVADSILLLHQLLSWVTDKGVELYSFGYMCHFNTFIFNASTFLIVWYSVCFVVDGFIVICCCERREKLGTVMRARLVMVALSAIAVIVFVNISLTYNASDMGYAIRCVKNDLFNASHVDLECLDLVVNVLIPYASFIYLLTHLIIARVRGVCRGRSLPTMRLNKDMPSNVSNRLQYPFALLVTFSISFLVFCLPYQVNRIYYGLLYWRQQPPYTRIEISVQGMCEVFQHIRCALNLLILVASCSKARHGFRQLILALIRTTVKACSGLVPASSSTRSTSTAEVVTHSIEVSMKEATTTMIMISSRGLEADDVKVVAV